MKACATLLLPLLLAACGEDPTSEGPIDVEGPGYRGVILARTAWPDHAYEVEGFWTPTVQDVGRAEAALPAAAREHAPELTVPFERYYRQYVGIVDEGRRLLYVNMIHEAFFAQEREAGDDDRQDPRTVLLVVDDGGDWFVEGFFDPASDTFTQLWVHGES